MAETDTPLKRLVQTAPADFASWLLGAEVLEIEAVNVELTADTLRVDQLYRVVLLDGRRALFHIEFQGRSSAKPMRWRMLEYMTRIADTEPDLDLLSAVIYVGEGAGVRDTGDHQVRAPDGATSLHWRCHVVRLWEMSAAELVALNRTGLLPLLGQTILPEPVAIVPVVVEQLQQVDDLALRSRLLASLISLIEDEEIVTMVEQLIEEEGLLLDTPYLRRLRTKAWTEGREEGRATGVAEGRVKGRVEGLLIGRRKAILDALVWRFDPSASLYRQIEDFLEQIATDAELERIFAALLQADTFADFQATISPSNQAMATTPE